VNGAFRLNTIRIGITGLITLRGGGGKKSTKGFLNFNLQSSQVKKEGRFDFVYLFTSLHHRSNRLENSSITLFVPLRSIAKKRKVFTQKKHWRGTSLPLHPRSYACDHVIQVNEYRTATHDQPIQEREYRIRTYDQPKQGSEYHTETYDQNPLTAETLSSVPSPIPRSRRDIYGKCVFDSCGRSTNERGPCVIL